MKPTVVVDSRIHIPGEVVAEMEREKLDALNAACTHENPAYKTWLAYRRGKGGYPPPKTVCTAKKEKGGGLSLPRGRMDAVQAAFGFDGYLMQDRRVVVPAPAVEWVGHQMRHYQERLIRRGLESCTYEWVNGVWRAPTGSGKCLGRGTPVMLYDGSVLPVEKILPGHLLMGPDSKPRAVKATSSGTGLLYQIEPVKGESWVCNADHVLTLVNTETDEIVEVSLVDYLRWSGWRKHCHKLFKVPVDFQTPLSTLRVSPYFLGIWLGDGGKDLERGVRITKPDREIYDAICAEALKFELRVMTDSHNTCPTHRVVGTKGIQNPLTIALREIVDEEFNVSSRYLCGTQTERLELLAGLLDTDGYTSNSGFDLVQKRQSIANAVVWLARSLGLRATISEKHVPNYGLYWRVSISGDCSKIPTRIARKQATPHRQKKNPLRTGFSVVPLGDGEYYGFTLDGDGRFLLGDFTVTHNTELLLNLISRLRLRALVVVPTEKIFDQWVERARRSMKGVKPGVIKSSKRVVGEVVTIGMQQTLVNCAAEYAYQFGAVIGDEAQLFAARTPREVIDAFPALFRCAVSDDEKRSDGREFFTYDYFGPVTQEVTREEAKSSGGIVDVEVVVVPTEYEADWYKRLAPSDKFERRAELLADMARNDERNRFIHDLAVELRRESGSQVAVLAQLVEHCEAIGEKFMANSNACVLLTGDEKDFDGNVAYFTSGSCSFAVATYKKVGVGFELTRELARGILASPVVSKDESRMQFFQFLGRFARSAEGKKKGVVYYPLDVRVFGKRPATFIHKWLKEKSFALVGGRMIPLREWIKSKDHDETTSFKDGDSGQGDFFGGF